MKVQTKIKIFAVCPACKEGEWRVDHLSVGFKTEWACGNCHCYFNVQRLGLDSFDFSIISGKKETPVTVTLKSVTEPPIILKLNTWKYGHSQKDSPEDYRDHQEYFYNEHTCPTNWTDQIEQIIFKGDTDPHGVFQFVSVEDGHLTGE